MPTILSSPQAERDLVSIWVYIAERNRAAADRLLVTLQTKLRALARMPGMGRDRSELAPELRSFPVRSYVIFYRQLRDTRGIELVRVVHGARDIASIFRRV